MVNLTIRNIPEELINKLRRLSEQEKRSMNSEVLVLMEKCLADYTPERGVNQISVDAQAELWNKLAGEWEDPRPARTIEEEIRAARTQGRKVDFPD
jgi:plasmid stability protein